jgi:hypothetical protein
MTGKTEQWEVTKKLFDFHAKRLGFNFRKQVTEDPYSTRPKTISEVPIQQTLF